MKQAQIRLSDGAVLAVGEFPSGSPDPGLIGIITLTPEQIAAILQPGAKTYDDGTGEITVTPPAPPPIDYGRTQPIGERRVTTTNTTPAELLRATIPPLTMYRARLSLSAIADNLSSRLIEAIVVVARGNNGAVIVQNASSQNQTVLADHRTNATAGSWTIVPSVSGNEYILTVTGSTGRTVDWRLTGDVESFAPSGL